MAGKKKDQIESRDITGLKYFDKLAPLLERLHDEGCQRDKAGNRELHYDQYCLLILLYLFNPVVTSLRGIQQASELEKVQKKLGCPRAALGSLSEAASVFDAERLKEIIAELGAELKPLGRDPRLHDIRQTLTLVDGTLIAALPKLRQASWLQQTTGSPGAPGVKWRLHTHFEVDRYVPTRIDVTPDGGGEHDERAVLERTIESDRLYVMDRGYAKFALFNRIVSAHSSYVCRLRDNSVYEVLEERELTAADRASGVLSDQIVRFHGKTDARPDHPLRLVCVKCSPHTTRGKYRGGSSGVDSDGVLRIATNLLDPPAEISGLIYAERWAIEIFFRFFKHLLGCRPRRAGAQPQPERHRNSSLLCDHRLFAHQPLDRSQADAADVRDDLLLLLRPGHGGGIAGASRQAETQGRRRRAASHRQTEVNRLPRRRLGLAVRGASRCALLEP